MSMDSHPAPARILIVEDNYLIAEEVRDLIRSFGYSVAGAAPSVADGLEILEGQQIDGAVLDIDLGGHTSFRLCRALKERGIPFAFLSGYSARNSMVPCEFSANLYLHKPVDPRQFKLALNAMLPPPVEPQVECRTLVRVETGIGTLSGAEIGTLGEVEIGTLAGAEIGTLAGAGIGTPAGAGIGTLIGSDGTMPQPGMPLPGSRVLGNQVLDGLSAEQRRAIAPHLEEVTLRKGDLLDAEGQEVSRVYFPLDALISIFAGNSHGQGIEVASIGNNGMTALSILLDDTTAPGDTRVQMSGRAWSIAAPVLCQLAERDCHLRRYLLGRISLALRDFMDASLSAGRLTVVERLARWLVRATHRVGSPRLVITHSALADILAVRRPSVTLGLQMLEGYGLIRSTRRVVMVRNPEGLSDVARLNGQSLNGRGSS